GTGAVGRRFKRLGMQVIANDLQYYAYVLNRAYIEINHTPSFDRLCEVYSSEISKNCSLFGDRVDSVLEFLNNLPNTRGFVAENYGPFGNRQYYTIDNAEKVDAIRQAI